MNKIDWIGNLWIVEMDIVCVVMVYVFVNISESFGFVYLFVEFDLSGKIDIFLLVV